MLLLANLSCWNGSLAELGRVPLSRMEDKLTGKSTGLHNTKLNLTAVVHPNSSYDRLHTVKKSNMSLDITGFHEGALLFEVEDFA